MHPYPPTGIGPHAGQLFGRLGRVGAAVAHPGTFAVTLSLLFGIWKRVTLLHVFEYSGT